MISKNTVEVVVAVSFAVVIVALGFFAASKLPKKSEVRYNCELAEISPDFPVAVKQKCRELRAKQ